MTAPVGAVVGLYYDGREVAVGDVLETPRGRRYLVVERRVQSRGRHIGRQHLRALVIEDIPSDSRVVPLYWYRRG